MAGPSRKGIQSPQGVNRGLHEILTDRELLAGLTVSFAGGLTFTVGDGWAISAGKISAGAAHELLRGWWKAHQPEWRPKGHWVRIARVDLNTRKHRRPLPA